MSSVSVSSASEEHLSRRVQALEQEAKGLSDALSLGRTIRWLLGLALLAFLGAIIWKFYQLGAQFKKKETVDRLLAMTEERLAARSDDFVRELQTLVDNSRPALTKAFLDQAKADTPAFLQRIEKEKDSLVQELQERLTEKVESHYRAVLSQHEALVHAEFPEAAQDKDFQQKMLGNVELAVNRLLKKHYTERLQHQMTAMYDAWEAFPAAEPPQPGDASLEDQLAGGMTDLLTLKLTETERPAP